jgi:hypothetical protein
LKSLNAGDSGRKIVTDENRESKAVNVGHEAPGFFLNYGHEGGRYSLSARVVTVLNPHISFVLCGSLLGGFESMEVTVLRVRYTL